MALAAKRFSPRLERLERLDDSNGRTVRTFDGYELAASIGRREGIAFDLGPDRGDDPRFCLVTWTAAEGFAARPRSSVANPGATRLPPFRSVVMTSHAVRRRGLFVVRAARAARGRGGERPSEFDFRTQALLPASRTAAAEVARRSAEAAELDE